jgi:hypothetical protein
MLPYQKASGLSIGILRQNNFSPPPRSLILFDPRIHASALLERREAALNFERAKGALNLELGEAPRSRRSQLALSIHWCYYL